MASDFWKEDDSTQGEVTIPDWTADGRFILEAFSDSSWAGCKTTRRPTSSGAIFLNGSLLTSICRTQASVALSSCEAELCAANGLMVDFFLASLVQVSCWRWKRRKQRQGTTEIVHGLSISVGTYPTDWNWTLGTHSDQTFFSKFAAYLCVFHFQSSHKIEPWWPQHQTNWMWMETISWNIDKILQSKWCRKKRSQHREKNPQNQSSNKRAMCPFDPNGKCHPWYVYAVEGLQQWGIFSSWSCGRWKHRWSQTAHGMCTRWNSCLRHRNVRLEGWWWPISYSPWWRSSLDLRWCLLPLVLLALDQWCGVTMDGSTIRRTTCGMADGTEVLGTCETESLGCMVGLEQGNSVFAWALSWVWAAWWLHGGRGERIWLLGWILDCWKLSSWSRCLGLTRSEAGWWTSRSSYEIPSCK